MATPKKKQDKPADPKEALVARITAARTVLAKHVTKPGNDPKRRLAHKKLKRAQRGLGKVVGMAKKVADKAAKKAAPKE